MNFHPNMSLGLEVTISLGIIVQALKVGEAMSLPYSCTLIITCGKLKVRTGFHTPSIGGIWNISGPLSDHSLIVHSIVFALIT